MNGFDGTSGEMQMIERIPWMPAFGIEYIVGIDGISIFLVLLTTLLMPIAILASWSVKDKVKEYLIFMLLLETGMLGAFVALDLFLFYVFWEVMLVPMYFLIGVWGGSRRIYAALKFVIYTMAGSLLMLVAIIYLATRYAQVEQVLTFDLLKLYTLHLPPEQQTWLFFAFALSFAIKVPLFPFHTWLPDAHVEAPTAGSVILAGVLLKLGTYGFLRFAMPLFPEAALAAAPVFVALAVVGIIYGAVVAMMQSDIKKLVAYSSVSHMGFVMLGLFAFNIQGVQGGLYQMLNHGLSTGALFLLVGMIYDRRHTRLIDDFGGLWKQIPLFSALLLVVTFSSIGLPGLNGFVGEFLILLGSFRVTPGWTAAAATGRYSRRDLHALDVSPGDLWSVDQSGQRKVARFERPGNSSPRADSRIDFGDGHLSPALSAADEAGGGAVIAADSQHARQACVRQPQAERRVDDLWTLI